MLPTPSKVRPYRPHRSEYKRSEKERRHVVLQLHEQTGLGRG
jgi:hypothetical protein